MKVTWIYYNDDDILIAGHLIKRFFRNPVFYPFERECGFDCQYITGRDQMVNSQRRIIGLSTKRSTRQAQKLR